MSGMHVPTACKYCRSQIGHNHDCPVLTADRLRADLAAAHAALCCPCCDDAQTCCHEKVFQEWRDAMQAELAAVRAENADLLNKVERLNNGIRSASAALDNYDYDTSLQDIMNGLDELLEWNDD